MQASKTWRTVIGLWALGALTGAAVAAQPVAPECFEASAQRHRLDVRLLKAVARVESGMNPGAVNLSHRERTGTVDIGLMQINSAWLPTLARHGIREANLREPCTNIEVGAWILADVVARHGNQWQAVGAYNAACTRLKGEACTAQRAAYAWKVFRRLDEPIANTKRGRARPRVEARSNGSGVTPAMASSLQIVSLRSPG